MGSVGAGIASIGGSLAQAKELQRKQALEELYAQIQRQYAQSRQEQLELEKSRIGIEKAREARLGRSLEQPTVQQWKIIGNSMVAAGQNADGTPFVKSIPLDRDISAQLQGLNNEIESAPEAIRPSLRNRMNSGIMEGDITSAAKDIRSVLSSVSKQMGAPGSVTTGTERVPIWLGPERGIEWWDVPINKYNQKMPAGSMPGIPGYTPSAPVESGGGGMPGVPAPVTSGALDQPGKPQAGLPAIPGAPTQQPSPTASMPAGSRRIGPAPPHAGGAAAKMKPEIDKGLKVLHASLFGSGGVPGLDSTVGVLDSWFSRKKLIQGGVGSTPDPNKWTISKQLDSEIVRSFTDEEAAFAYQLKRAVSAINALRGVTGLPRSTQQLMETYAQELPNPIVTPSSKRARYQLQLIEREIRVAMDDAVKTVALQERGDGGGGGPDPDNPLGLKFNK